MQNLRALSSRTMQNVHMPVRVLVVDDEENLRLVLRTLLRKHGYEVAVAPDAREGLLQVAGFDPDFVLADVRMPGMSGLEFCGELKKRQERATVIMMSAFGSVELALEAMKVGAYDYISKPFKQDEVLLALRKAEEREALKRENKILRETVQRQGALGEMMGQSDVVQTLFRTVEKVAVFKTTVLIEGESGTGKELIARALHRLSPRAKGPFVAVNCGAIPANLLESELFGYKRGAFTDATVDKQGLFEEADGGTLFLDEVGELPLPLQVKMLRVLQEGALRRLGETKDRAIDVRLVAATVRNLERDVASGRFREDLYYRLNVVSVRPPPLRERREDIPLLAEHFVQKTNAKLGTHVRTINPAARKLLFEYPWPGNVRELENTIERAVVMCAGDIIGEEELPPRIHEMKNATSQVLTTGELSIKKSVRFIEETLIKRALEKTRGNRTAAAKILEISHRALLYKLKEYGLGRDAVD